jgi:hypothetical protein
MQQTSTMTSHVTMMIILKKTQCYTIWASSNEFIPLVGVDAHQRGSKIEIPRVDKTLVEGIKPSLGHKFATTPLAS